MLTKLTTIIVINHFVIIVNFRNRFVKALTVIFQFFRALLTIDPLPYLWSHLWIMSCIELDCFSCFRWFHDMTRFDCLNKKSTSYSCSFCEWEFLRCHSKFFFDLWSHNRSTYNYVMLVSTYPLAHFSNPELKYIRNWILTYCYLIK